MSTFMGIDMDEWNEAEQKAEEAQEAAFQAFFAGDMDTFKEKAAEQKEHEMKIVKSIMGMFGDSWATEE